MEKIKKLKDWYIQGFQLQKCYEGDWEEIKETFKSYGLYLADHGPILTMHELKYIRNAKELTEKLIAIPDIRKIAIKGSIIENEQELKGRIFMLILQTMPVFCRKLGEKQYEEWITNSDGVIQKLFDIGGTMKENDLEIERIVTNDIFLTQNKKFKKNLKKVFE